MFFGPTTLLPNFVIGVRGKICCFVVQTLEGRDLG